MKKVSQENQRGITLIELLITITMLGILTVMGLTSYLNTQRTTRNARRMQDLKEIQNALEAYYNDNSNTYPHPDCDTGITGNYMRAGVPSDPSPGQSYTKSCPDPGVSYCICAMLEGGASGNATNTSCTYGSGSYYCVSNLQ